MESNDWLPSYYEAAAKIVQECHSTLFKPEEHYEEGNTPDWHYEISRLTEEQVTEIISEELEAEDSWTLVEQLKQECAKTTIMFSPNFEGIDESFNYGNSPQNFRVDDNLITALKFFNVPPSILAFLMKNYEVSKEFKALGDFQTEETSIVTPERAALMMENTYRYWMPAAVFNISITDLLAMSPGTKVNVKGGIVGCFDILNGSGHAETMEEACELNLTINNPKEFINHSEDSDLDKMMDNCFGFVRSVYKSEISLS